MSATEATMSELKEQYTAGPSGDSFAMSLDPGSALATVESTRAIAEIQAALVIAKRFPRNERAAYSKIMQACERPSVAENAHYSYKRGTSQIEAPNIRLAEVMARAWGNCEIGWKVLSQDEHGSEILAFAWDLETNYKPTINFYVPHEMKVKDKQGGADKIKKLTDPRDIYEHCANMSSRRVRACILRVIPGDVTEEASNKCKRTMSEKAGAPLADRIRQMIATFQRYNVTEAMLEKRLAHNLDAISEQEMITLRGVFNAIKDGLTTPQDEFDFSTSVSDLRATQAKTPDTKPPPADDATAGVPHTPGDKPTTEQPWVNAYGEYIDVTRKVVWSQADHATNRDTKGPSYNSDGTFRERRNVAAKDEPSPESAPAKAAPTPSDVQARLEHFIAIAADTDELNACKDMLRDHALSDAVKTELRRKIDDRLWEFGQR